MDLFIINRYDPADIDKNEGNDEEALRKRFMSKIEDRKRKLNQDSENVDIASEKKPKNDTTEKIEQNDTVKKKKKKIKQVAFEETLTSIEEVPPPQEYVVLGKDSFAFKEKVKRILPNWLKNPSVVSVDLKNLENTIDSIPQLDKALVDKLKANKINYFFPVQAQVIPWLLKDINRPSMYWANDICVSAPTGSGKTLAFVLPIVQALQNRLTIQIRALVVLPVHDLAKQVYTVFRNYASHTDLSIVLLSNAVKFSEEQKLLVRKDKILDYRNLADIVVTTPGRLVDHLQHTTGISLTELRYLVIDEADRVMENIQNDWLYHVNTHLGLHSGSSKSFQVPPLCLNTLRKEKRPPQKLLFSATLSQDPEKLQQLGLFQPKLFTSVVKSQQENGKGIKSENGDFVGKFTTPAELSESSVVCSLASKPLVLFHLIQTRGWRNILIFTKSCEATHRLALLLKCIGRGKLKVAEITAKTTAVRRNKRLLLFATGKLQIIVSSDALARGIDIPNVECVVSYDAPKFIKNYVHRVGRTGRAGNDGVALTLLLPEEVKRFNKIMTAARKTSIENIEIAQEELEQYSQIFQSALTLVKKKLEIRTAIQNHVLTVKKGIYRSKNKKLKKNKK